MIKLQALKEILEKNTTITIGVRNETCGTINYEGNKATIEITKSDIGVNISCDYNKNIINNKKFIFNVIFTNVTSYKEAEVHIEQYLRKLNEVIKFFIGK